MKRWSIVKNLLTLLFFNDQTTASVTPPNVSGGITAGGWAVIGNVIAVITLKSKRAFETLNYCFHSSFFTSFYYFHAGWDRVGSCFTGIICKKGNEYLFLLRLFEEILFWKLNWILFLLKTTLFLSQRINLSYFFMVYHYNNLLFLK